MSASLVGSEMCIRDRVFVVSGCSLCPVVRGLFTGARAATEPPQNRPEGCLLYTSDAADDM
eukprot:6293881-Alexandrium_andersonii.AAC.1